MGSRRELTSRTSFLAHARLETGVAAREFRHWNEKSRAAARACLASSPPCRHVRLPGELEVSQAHGEIP
ncbi:hypothetical protein HOLleu_41475 [Holothuria leucospilota]|uniref:Uncharacterized protein n=1 Tax=Holothuria leucospilota TaxID=206669 RepID=A0A9Q1BC45_HOLLE|nr:hypothetical protein HOLleu_41475 [Holothuria leucospilota]